MILISLRSGGELHIRFTLGNAAPLTVAMLISLYSVVAVAGPYEDCILQNMKGIQDRLAAVEVQKACRRKADDYKRERVQEFGEKLDGTSFKDAPTWEIESPGFHAIQFTNTNSDRTITYARIRVAPAEEEGKPCDLSRDKAHSYRLSLKPGQSVRLIYPSSATKSECIRVEGVLGRVPSWRDLSFSSSASPIAKDPLADIE